MASVTHRSVVDALTAELTKKRASPSPTVSPPTKRVASGTPSPRDASHLRDARFKDLEALLQDPLAAPPMSCAELPLEEVQRAMCCDNQMVACWSRRPGAGGKIVPVDLAPYGRASEWAQRFGDVYFESIGIEDHRSSIIPALGLVAVAHGGFNSCWSLDPAAPLAAETLYPSSILSRLRSNEVVLRIASDETRGEARDVVMREACHILFAAQRGFGPRCAGVAMFPRKRAVGEEGEGGVDMAWFLVAFIERAPLGNCLHAKRFQAPVASLGRLPPSPRTVEGTAWLRVYFDALLFTVYLYSVERFIFLDTKLQNFVAWCHPFWESRGWRSDGDHRILAIDLGHDVFKRLESSTGATLSCGPSEAYKWTFLYNVLHLSASLRRDFQDPKLFDLWWERLARPVRKLHAQLQMHTPPPPPVGAGSGVVVGPTDTAGLLMRKLLRETQWSGPFRFFADGEYEQFQWQSTVRGVQLAMGFYVRYYFIEYIYIEAKRNASDRFHAYAEARNAGTLTPAHATEAEKGVRYFNTHYCHRAHPVAKFFLESLSKGRTVLAQLLAFVDTPLPAKTSRQLAPLANTFYERCTARDVHPDNGHALWRLFGLS